ncbi:MAG TPA: peptidoglycan-binding domain-containing protein [Gemmatimonadaceae bacterium]|nr:peptidoglycan-binding domain-containing protein [Gemmatimonadaceae bacterium]
MRRWTAVAIAFAASLAACKGSEQRATNAGNAMGSAAANAGNAVGNAAQRGAAQAGTTAAGITSSAAGALDTMGRKADTAMSNMKSAAGSTANKAKSAAGNAANKAKSAAGAVGAGASSAALTVKLHTLSQDHVKQLQTALNNIGCDAGKPDGVVGNGTVKAVRCGFQKKNISDNDLDALYQALGLNFGS